MEQSFHVPGICRSCNLLIPGRGNRTILIWCISDIYKLGRRIQQQTFCRTEKLCGSSCRQQLLAVPGTDTAVCGSFRNTGKRDRIFTGTAGNRKN